MRLSFRLIIALFCLAAIGSAFGQTNSGGVMPMRATPTQADKIRLDNLKKDYDRTKAALAKSPKNAKAKKDFVKAATVYGHESMVSPVLAPHVKYPQALRIYGEVLRLDPNNPVAKPESDLMIRIYKQMGKPVPKH